MSFRRAIINNLTAAQRDAFDDSFKSTYDRARDMAEANLVPKQQPRMTSESSPATLQQQRDALQGFSRDTNYSAIQDGLAYLDQVTLVTKGVKSGTIARLNGEAQVPSIRDLGASEGAAFVKTALGLDVVDTLGDEGLITQAGQYSAAIFAEIQAGTFAPTNYYQGGKAIAQNTHNLASSQLLPSSGTDAVRRSFEAARLQQQGLFFNAMPQAVAYGLEPNALYGDFGLAQANIGRIPSVKVKFLFYCDMELWVNGTYQLMTIKSCSGPETTFVQEDVNHYGLRSKVNKSVTYGNLSLSLYDDTANTTAALFNTLMAASTGSFGPFNVLAQQRLQYVAGSAELAASETIPAVLPLHEVNGVVRSIRTSQVYVHNGMVVRDITTYVNPKIVSLKRSGVDMENGVEASSIDMEFAYEALNIELGIVESPTWREQRDRGV